METENKLFRQIVGGSYSKMRGAGGRVGPETQWKKITKNVVSFVHTLPVINLS